MFWVTFDWIAGAAKMYCAAATFDERVHCHLVAVFCRLELYVDVSERPRSAQVVPDGSHVATERRVLVACTSELFR